MNIKKNRFPLLAIVASSSLISLMQKIVPYTIRQNSTRSRKCITIGYAAAISSQSKKPITDNRLLIQYRFICSLAIRAQFFKYDGLKKHMSNIVNYLWPIVLAIYIISPFDAHPLFLDDLVAAGVMFYMLYKNARRKRRFEQYYTHSRNQSQDNSGASRESRGPLTLDNAYRLLGVSASASWDEINKAYREKISRSHPDKVSHLSEELQDRAKELTLRLNEALDLIKRHKGRA